MLRIISSWKTLESSPTLLQPTTHTTLLIDAPERFPSNTRRIFVMVEPEAIHKLRQYAILFASQYDYILTFDEEVLQACPNARKYVYGTTWIFPAEWQSIDVQAKQFAVSGVAGSKASTDGHLFRRALYMNQHRFPLPTTLFIGQGAALPNIQNNQALGPKKLKLFSTFQFSLVIENSRQANYFTEKLCDCLITKTIPIYYGCPNIGDYFDTSGWIILDRPNVEIALQRMSMLNPGHYEAYWNTVLHNFEAVKQYIDLDENINRVLRDIPDY
jgi:hypothetical protein